MSADESADVTPQDLTTFQHEILLTLADARRVMKGAAITDAMWGRYGDVGHGRLYPNLDSLVEMGLVEKSQRDGRTNDYALTSDAWALLRMDAMRRRTLVYGGESPSERQTNRSGMHDRGSQPVTLRDGETPDEMGHAARNAAQLRSLERDG